MRRIVRRNLVRDPAGRALSMRSERLTDDGRGSLQQTSEQTAAWCSGCRRPLTELSELRGVCDSCHTRECCVHCLSHCEVCSRRLCGHCRCGFAGPPPLTVCASCQEQLIHRQILQDQQTAFEQELARHRLFNQDQALRLNFERAEVAAQLQEARLNQGRVWWPIWVLQRVGSGVVTVVKHALRTLR